MLLLFLLCPVGARVAVCLTGSVRTFAYTAVHATLSNLLTENTDLFVFIQLTAPAFKDNNDLSCYPFYHAFDVLKPLHVSVQLSSDDCSQVGRIASCFAFAEAHAHKNGFEYDAFVRARPDMAYGGTLPMLSASDSHVYVADKEDILFVLSRHMIKTWWNPLGYTCSSFSIGSGCCPEDAFQALKLKKLNETNGMLVRRWNRIECWGKDMKCANETQHDQLLLALAREQQAGSVHCVHGLPQTTHVEGIAGWPGG